jgi:hypothetical protein
VRIGQADPNARSRSWRAAKRRTTTPQRTRTPLDNGVVMARPARDQDRGDSAAASHPREKTTFTVGHIPQAQPLG